MTREPPKAAGRVRTRWRTPLVLLMLSFSLDCLDARAETPGSSSAAPSGSVSADRASANIRPASVRVVHVVEESDDPRFETSNVALFPETEDVEILGSGRFTGGRCDELLARERSTGQLLLRSGEEPVMVRRWESGSKLPLGAAVQTGDLDGDGFDDIIIAPPGDAVLWMRSDGTGGFAPGRSLRSEKFRITGLIAVAPSTPHPDSTHLFAEATFDSEERMIVSTMLNGNSLVLASRLALLDSHLPIIGFLLDQAEPDGIAGFVQKSEIKENLWNRSYLHPGNRALWAQLPTGITWRSELFGDLNGDLRPDLLAYGGEFVGWWTALNAGAVAFPRSLRGLPIPGASPLILSDIDCDGAKDVLARSTIGRSTAVSFSRLSRGVEGVRIKSKGRLFGVTDSTGTARFEANDLDDAQLHLYADRHLTQNVMYRTARRRAGVEHEIATFAVADAAKFPERQGLIGRYYTLGPRPPGPYVCLNFSTTNSVDQWSTMFGECPSDHALVTVAVPRRSFNPRGTLIPSWQCCPLPSSDVLSGRRVEADESCPEGTVAVGFSPGPHCRNCAQRLICAELSPRFKLSSPQQGAYWGTGRLAERSARQILPSDVPGAFRDALGRYTMDLWLGDGCIGYPWGSLLTAVRGDRSCDNVEFRTLLTATEENGVPAGTPVPIFPDCREVVDPMTPLSGCRR